jgi:hypothetical protein
VRARSVRAGVSCERWRRPSRSGRAPCPFRSDHTRIFPQVSRARATTKRRLTRRSRIKRATEAESVGGGVWGVGDEGGWGRSFSPDFLREKRPIGAWASPRAMREPRAAPGPANRSRTRRTGCGVLTAPVDGLADGHDLRTPADADAAANAADLSNRLPRTFSFHLGSRCSQQSEWARLSHSQISSCPMTLRSRLS